MQFLLLVNGFLKRFSMISLFYVSLPLFFQLILQFFCIISVVKKACFMQSGIEFNPVSIPQHFSGNDIQYVRFARQCDDLLPRPTGERVTGTYTIKGEEYCFTKKGVLRSRGFLKNGTYVDSTGHKLRKNTIKGLLKTALMPVGSTMYVWGGGWNIKDTGAGAVARTIGVSPRWKQYFQQQTSAYDYTRTRYQVNDGLDCSGYVGWTLYNTFNTSSGNEGYVMLAQVMARTFAGYGWGSYTSAGAVRNFKAGDIMSLASGHVYIVVGQCADGSVVLLHSSPKGVMISGTYTRSGSPNSEAVRLATKYMKQYYPAWYAKYPKVSRNTDYLTRYSQMRWYLTGKKVMLTDPDGYTKKTAAQILKDLFK